MLLHTGSSPVAVHTLLVERASLVAGHRPQGVQAQELWLSGLAAPRHLESSRARGPTRVPCVGRRILNH